MTVVKDILKDDLRPFVEADSNGHFNILLDALAAMGQPLFDVVSDSDDGPGWSALLDIDRTTSDRLGYLAQFVGVRLFGGLDDAAQRSRIRSTDGRQRGTPAAIVGAAQQFLTGTRSVILRERFKPSTATENAYWMQLITLDSETPDPTLVQSAVMAQKPGGDLIAFAVVTGQDWLDLKNNYGSWTAVQGAFGSWQAVRDNAP